MKKPLSIAIAALLSIVLVLSLTSFALADDSNSKKIPDKDQILKERAEEIQKHLSSGVNWDILLPKLKELVKEELGYIPDGFGEDPGTKSVKYISDDDSEDYGDSYCDAEFSSACDFRVLSVGIDGSLDTAWHGYDPHWYADEIELLSEWYLVTLYPYWLTPDDPGWWTSSASAYYSETVEDDWHIPYDFEDLGGAMTGFGWLQQYEWAWHTFEDENDTVSLYCSDSCWGSW
jgi:hypothetical protein